MRRFIGLFAIVLATIITPLVLADTTTQYINPGVKELTWKNDSTGCFHTRKYTYVDSTWQPSDSVLIRCPRSKDNRAFWDY